MPESFNSSIFLAVLLGMLLLAVVLAFGVMIARALAPRPTRGVPLVASEDGHYEASGKRIKCSHCGGVEFHAKEILLNTWLLSLLRIDWLDASATALTCEKCGKLTWFSQDSVETNE